MQLVLDALVPGVRVLDLISDLTPFRPDLAAYLLPALVRDTPPGTLFLCIVDPGVGGERAALALEADGRWFVGPDNGLLAVVARRARRLRLCGWVGGRPGSPRASTVATCLPPSRRASAGGQDLGGEALDGPALAGWDWPEDLARVVYSDRYGNLMSGWRAERLDQRATLSVAGQEIGWARTFCEAPPGTAFWYENAFGLVEIAVNQGRADQQLRPRAW